jgi:hypothetical protein
VTGKPTHCRFAENFSYAIFHNNHSHTLKPLHSYSFVSLAILSLVTGNLRGQTRAIGAESLVLDNGAGNTITLQTPVGGWSGNIPFVIPISPAGSPPSGFIYPGTSAGQMLTWVAPNTTGPAPNNYAGGPQGSWQPIPLPALTGVNLQATTPGTQQTGNINVSGAIIGSNALTTGGLITASNNGGSLSIDPTGTGSGNFLQFNAAGGTTEDIYGTNGEWYVDINGNAVFNSLISFNTFYTPQISLNVAVDQSGEYYMGYGDFTVVEEGGNNSKVFLPEPASGRMVAVKFADATATDHMTVASPGIVASIDGQSIYTLNGYGGAHPNAITVVSDGDVWYIIGSH